MNVLYIVSRYPHPYQTFVQREIDAVRRCGVHVAVTAIVGGPWRPAAAVRWFFRRPRTWLALVGRILADTAWRPRVCAKSLAAFARGCAVADAIRPHPPDAVHAHWATYPATAALAVAGFTSVPFSFAVHAYDVFQTRTLIPFKVRSARFVVVNCRYTRDELCRLYPPLERDKLILLYNSLDARAFALQPAQPAAPPVVLGIGQLVATKGFHVLIEAFARLRAAGRTAVLRLVGTGPEQARLAALAARLNVAADVRFDGFLEPGQVQTLLRTAAVLAMPCVHPRRGSHDALPNVILEAQAAGVPVVASALFGIPEVVADGRTGLLVAPHQPAELAAALRTVLDNPALAAGLAKAARQQAEVLFDGSRNGATLVGLFKERRS